MKSFDQINRRTHLYLGLFLTPWLLMYGVSSVLISHHSWFRSAQPPAWQPVFEREYHRPVPDQTDLRDVAQAIRDQNSEVALGMIGSPPVREDQAFARTLSASDPVGDQREALLLVLGNLCDRVAGILNVDLRGVDLAFVDNETREEASQ